MDGRDGGVYRGMSRAKLDSAYNNLAAVADSGIWIESWQARSEGVRQRPGARLDIAYGEAARAKLDYFACGTAGAPLFVFIHGGYWMRNHKDMFAFVAEGPMAAGFDVAIICYTLAPEARLGQIADEIAHGVSFLAGRASQFGFQREKMIVGGWSAGGHLAAMLGGHPSPCAILPISGIFNLEPISHSYINDVLTLTADEVETLSPMKRLDGVTKPICVAWGGAELPELQRQSEDFVAAARTRGVPIEGLPLAQHHHFSILDALAIPGGEIVSAMERLAEL